METLVFLSLGTNLGERLDNLSTAVARIHEEIGEIERTSNIYTTPPWGFVAEKDFLNCCLAARTSLSPQEVLRTCKSIEYEMGRTPRNNTEGYKSRIIDIDIILYGELFLESKNLVIPHPHFRNRKFVLAPLNEIGAECIDPVTAKTIKQLCEICTDNSKVYLFED